MNQDIPALRPETAVDLIMSPGVIRRTFVLDISGDRIVLAKPRPPLEPPDMTRPAILTYLPADQPETRYGFDVLVMSILADFTKEGKIVPAAIVMKTSEARRMDLRAFPRIKIDGLRVLFGDEELDVMNISSGGAHLVRRTKSKEPVKVGETIVLSLIRGNDAVEREARILRQWHVRLSGFDHLAVKFLQPVDF